MTASTSDTARPVGSTDGSEPRSSADVLTTEARSSPPVAHSADVRVAQLRRELARSKQQLAEMERQISDVRKSLRLVLDQAPDCVLIVDREYRILLANRASTDLWGVAPTEVAVGLCYEVHRGAKEPCPDCPAAQAFCSGLPVSMALENAVGHERSSRWQVTSYPLKDEHGRVVRVVNFAVNLTKRHWHQALTLQAVRLSAVGELAAGIAHQINNPLAAIIGNAQLLLREFDSSHSAWAALQNIERAGLRSSAVVEALLSFSHQGEYLFQPTNVNQTIQDALGMVSYQIRRGNANVIVELADDLPLVPASTPHLQTTWINLLLNARDAIEDHDGEIRIGTERSEDGRWVRVYVSDNGRGIPPEDLDRVFEPFFTTKEPNEGTGLGLFICYGVVTKHKGRIEVDSRLGVGSVFRVSLPVEG